MNLIGRYFLLLLSVITLVSFVQVGENFLQNNDNYVHWGERDLKWSDFQGPVPDDSKFHALTHSAISLDFQSDGVILEFKIESVFDPSKSWKKEGVNSYILKHEQLHFDITEYHARLLRKEIKTTKYTSFNTIETQIRNMFNETYNEANQMQIDYDKET
ncbi:MAG: DUF922 domain-containing protein, partial [Crocinitomicaceae bacterium]|nr:DUF922 domain-containing protein [Crocinitomicaceae bacterium]